MHKIIFLDIDGVLNVLCENKDEYGCIFHEQFVDNLKYIIDETDAKIVISSSWRDSGLDIMKELWKFRNLPGEVIDITPTVLETADYFDIEFYDLVDRGYEIQQWLDTNNVLSYVIIDDINDMLPTQKDFFVRTLNPFHSDSLSGGYGLTKECAKRAIEILNERIKKHFKRNIN